MKLNASGLVIAESVVNAKQVALRPREDDTIRQRLARARMMVQLGEIAVLGDRKWLRVRSADHHGTGWIEIETSAPDAEESVSGE